MELILVGLVTSSLALIAYAQFHFAPELIALPIILAFALFVMRGLVRLILKPFKNKTPKAKKIAKKDQFALEHLDFEKEKASNLMVLKSKWNLFWFRSAQVRQLKDRIRDLEAENKNLLQEMDGLQALWLQSKNPDYRSLPRKTTLAIESSMTKYQSQLTTEKEDDFSFS